MQKPISLASASSSCHNQREVVELPLWGELEDVFNHQGYCVLRRKLSVAADRLFFAKMFANQSDS